MAAQRTIDILNELLAIEQRSLAPRLVESTLFVDRASTADLANMQGMARACEEHGAWLAEVIIDLGGIPAFRDADLNTTDMHYLDLRHNLPRFISDREALIEKYLRATEWIDNEPRAADLIQRILQRHRQELAALQPPSDQSLSGEK